MKLPIPNSQPEAYAVMQRILQGGYTTAEIIDFLRYYQNNKVAPEILKSFLNAIKASAVYSLDSNGFDKPLIDSAGTGGDGKNTINLSTLTGLFCAATGLVKVVKYGNRAASGLCGSMDVLEATGVPIKLSRDEVSRNLKHSHFSPLFARAIYPGAQHVAEARSKVKGPTIFNLLFPLARPVSGELKFVFGVADRLLFDLITELYSQEKTTRCAVVHGLDGTDEVSVSGSGETEYAIIDEGTVVRGLLNCKKDFDIRPVALSDLQVTSKAEAVILFSEVCNPYFVSSKCLAIRQAVYANAAVALFVGLDIGNMNIQKAKKYLPLLKETLSSGKVISLLKNLQTMNVSNV